MRATVKNRAPTTYDNELDSFIAKTLNSNFKVHITDRNGNDIGQRSN